MEHSAHTIGALNQIQLTKSKSPGSSHLCCFIFWQSPPF